MALTLLAPVGSAHAAPDAAFFRPPARVAPGPPNGDFAAGVSGWTAVGPRPVVATAAGAARFVRLGANTTLLSSSLAVPGRAQTISIEVRSRTRSGILMVRALREDGRQTTLGTIAPANGFRRYEVGLGPVRGETVRLVLDPVAALGRTVDVRRVGPQRQVGRGWLIRRGAPRRVARGVVEVATGQLVMSSASFRPGASARATQVQVRGTGVVRLRAGGRTARLRASSRQWRTLRVRLSPRALRASVSVTATPGAGILRLRRVGSLVRRPRLRSLSTRFPGGRRVITGRLAPAGGRLWIDARAANGLVVGRARSDGRGTFRIVARGVATRLSTTGDGTRVATAWSIR